MTRSKCPSFQYSLMPQPAGRVLFYEVLVGNPYEVEFVTIDSIMAKLKASARKRRPAPGSKDIFRRHQGEGRKRDHLQPGPGIRSPVAVHHRGGHTSFYNSKAFEMADINKNSPIGRRDATASGGNVNGRVTDRAGRVSTPWATVRRFPRRKPGSAPRGPSLHLQAIRALDVTSVQHEGGDLFALQEVRAQGELSRVSYEPKDEVLEAMIPTASPPASATSGYGSAPPRNTLDGSFSERTMAFSVPIPASSRPTKAT